MDNSTTERVSNGSLAYVYPFVGRTNKEVYTVKLSDTPSPQTYRRTTQLTNVSRRDESDTIPFTYTQGSSFWEEQGADPYSLSWFRSASIGSQVDGYGNVTNVSRWSYVSSGGVLIPPTQVETVTIGYKNDAGKWLIGLAESIEQSSFSNGRTRTRRSRSTYYDTGLLESVERAPDHALDPIRQDTSDVNLYTYYGRDIYGLVTSVAKSGSNSYLEETINYDLLDNTFPRLLTDTAGHKEQVTYHSGLGIPAIRIDANGLKTTNYYDGYGRLRYSDKPGKADVSIDYTWGNLGQEIVRQVSQSENAFHNPRDYLVFDRLGRPARHIWTGFDGSLSTEDVSYDKLGHVESVSLPYQGTKPPEWATTRFGYDNLGRLRLLTQPGVYRDSRLIDRGGLTTKSWGEDGTLSYVVEDALGRPVRAVDVDSSGHEIAMTFDFGPFGVLEGVTDPYQRRTPMEYDDIGRRVRVQDLDAGAQQSYFDAFGNLKTFVDGNGNSSVFRYDALQRLYSRTDPDGTTLTPWDNGVDGLGILLQTQTPDGISSSHSFDEEGRPKLDTWAIDGSDFTIMRYYDDYE